MDTNICRVCLDKTATISVFDNQDDNIQISTKIMQCVDIRITENDGLPNSVCVDCTKDLNITYEFIQKCIASDKSLRSLNVDLYVDTKLDLNIKDEFSDQDNFDDFLQDETDIKSEEPIEIATPKNVSKDKKSFTRKYVRKKRGKMDPIQCVICGLMVTSPSAMSTHMRTHTGEKPFSCPQCISRFTTKGALKRHIETYHSTRERKFTCETCGNSFFRKNDIIIHMRVHTDERPYVCSICSSRFRQVASLIRHRRVHTGEKNYSCPICHKKFADSNLVKKHQLVHTDEKNFTCHLCSKSVKSRSALNVHLSLHTNEKKYVCSFCGVGVSTKSNLKKHIQRVHSEKSGQCSVCLKTFSELEEHMRKHTGEKPFICKKCNQGFASKRSLAHHVLFKHENASKFKCSIGDCTRTFPTAMLLEFHLLKHTNHTPYVCQHCSRGFFRTSDLSRHLRVSHMELPIKIPLKTEH